MVKIANLNKEIRIQYLNSNGTWDDMGETDWDEVISEHDKEILDEVYNNNGIRIFCSDDDVFIYRSVKVGE